MHKTHSIRGDVLRKQGAKLTGLRDSAAEAQLLKTISSINRKWERIRELRKEIAAARDKA